MTLAMAPRAPTRDQPEAAPTISSAEAHGQILTPSAQWSLPHNHRLTGADKMHGLRPAEGIVRHFYFQCSVIVEAEKEHPILLLGDRKLPPNQVVEESREFSLGLNHVKDRQNAAAIEVDLYVVMQRLNLNDDCANQTVCRSCQMRASVNREVGFCVRKRPASAGINSLASRVLVFDIALWVSGALALCQCRIHKPHCVHLAVGSAFAAGEGCAGCLSCRIDNRSWADRSSGNAVGGAAWCHDEIGRSLQLLCATIVVNNAFVDADRIGVKVGYFEVKNTDLLNSRSG